jgi:hypothetical protein
MATLFDYLKQCQSFLRDGSQKLFDVGDLIRYTNMARREVAMRAQCVRVLPPISGAIISASILNGGTGYTNPTVEISFPDSPGGQLLNSNGAQAIGVATQVGGVIQDVNITYGGDGYYQPTIAISDPTGKGAVIQPNLSPIMTANFAQEVYNFSDVPLDNFPGVESVYAVLSVSLLYANGRYSVLIYSFSQYQAMIRQYGPGNYYYVPCMGAQYGRGAGGSFYLYPPPSQSLQMEFDCCCLPSDLTADSETCPIPDPWTDAVPYWAAHLAMLELQNHNMARSYLDLFDRRMHQFGAYSLPGRAISPYGRP